MILAGDCLTLMPTLEADSVDAIVTDPPYGLAFMGKAWDHGVPGVPFWVEALRVAKPGAHLVAFGGTRTYHRLTCAIEDAGWEIRDCLSWMFGQGFPKSLDVSKAIDKVAGATREVVGQRSNGAGNGSVVGLGSPRSMATEFSVTAPATDAARQWSGWGTALKPAWEPIILARKPLAGTVAANVTAHGTGGLNVDGCRVEIAEDDRAEMTGRSGRSERPNKVYGKLPPVAEPFVPGLGRWPANVVLDPDAAAMLDEQSGERPGMREAVLNRGATTGKGLGYGSTSPQEAGVVGYSDTGGASRFFYCAKASRAEREEGLEGMGRKAKLWSSGEQSPGTFQAEGTDRTSTNHHPTVKPVALMRWLCRLITPPGGLILDPFTGSGTTGIAAALEDFRFLGIEREPEYVAIAEARIAKATEQPSLWSPE